MDAGYAEASASQRAYKLSKLEEVQERIVELTRQIQRQRVTTSAISREACESRLWEEAQDMENSPAARIRAIEVLGKYKGYLAENKQPYKLPSDISQCTEQELDWMVDAILTVFYGTDEAKKASVKKRLAAEAGLVIEAGPTNGAGGSALPTSETNERTCEF